MSTRLFSARWYRSRLFWLLVLVGLYTILGTVVLPRVVDTVVKESIDENLGWQTRIQDVSFNPFDFHLAVKGVEIVDENQQKVAAFDGLILNLDTFALSERALGFEVTELRRPYVRVEVYPGGTETNFGRAVRRQAALTPATPTEDANTPAASEPDDTGELPRLRFDQVRIVDADIDILDQSQGESVEHRLSPLNLTLYQFATYHDRSDKYQISIDLGKGQIINWRGVINMVSRQSKGSLSLENLQLADLAPYLKPYTDYRIQDGRLSFQFHYDVSVGAKEALSLSVSEGALKTEQLAVALGEGSPFVELASLDLKGAQFNLAKHEAGLERIALDGLKITVARDSEGAFRFLPPEQQPANGDDSASEAVPDGSAPETEPVSTDQTPAQPFHWSVSEVSLANSQLTWQDDALPTPAQLAVADITMRLGKLSDDLEAEVPFEVSLRPLGSGTVSVDGNLKPASGDLKANLAIDQFQLPSLQAYLEPMTPAQVKKGLLSVNGALTLSPKSESKGQFSGRIAVSDVEVAPDNQGDAFVQWQNVALEGLDVQVAPLVLAADELVIDTPQVNLAISDQGKLNLASLSKAPEATQDEAPKGVESVPASSEPSDTGTPAPDIRLSKLTLKNGGLAFSDQTYDPAVDIELRNFAGEIVNLSSDKAARSQVNLKGDIGEYGKLTVKGTVNPLSEKLFTDMRILLNRFDMTELSPYTGRYVGNVVEKGKMNLDLTYQIDNDRLKAGNQVLLQKFTLGEAVKSDQATSLPVDLALALLTDRQGQIDIDLPIEGNLNDPEFRVGKVVLSALGNLITKAATSPFALIGGLVGESDGLDEVVFSPGISRLDEIQVQHLDQLAKALVQRPSLGVEVRGLSNPEVDREALQALRLTKRKDAIRSTLAPAATENDVLIALITQAGQASSLSGLPDIKADPEGYQAALSQLAQSTVQVEKSALRKLAARRAAAIQRQLVDGNGLEQDRVFQLDPLVKATEGGDAVVIPLVLHAL